jgi:hypothetical protein
MKKQSKSFFDSLFGRSNNENETISIRYIDKICNEGCEISLLIDLIVKIGHESLDQSQEYIGGGFQVLNGSVPKKVVWPPKEGLEPFQVFDNITKEWKPDPRILKIGMVLNHTAGLELMQHVAREVNQKYHGGMRSLELAWDGIGKWRF